MKNSKCYSKAIRDRKSCSKCITKSKGRRNKETKRTRFGNDVWRWNK